MAVPQERPARQFIKPTDSDYVKLAKQGGDRDLLVAHEVVKSDTAKPYTKCEWFDHIHNAEEDAQNRITSNQAVSKKLASAKEQNEMVSARMEGSRIKQKYTGGGAPFHTDNMSVWERRKTVPETPEARAGRHGIKPQLQ